VKGDEWAWVSASFAKRRAVASHRAMRPEHLIPKDDVPRRPSQPLICTGRPRPRPPDHPHHVTWEGFTMSTITAQDSTEIFFKHSGSKDAQPIMVPRQVVPFENAAATAELLQNSALKIHPRPLGRHADRRSCVIDAHSARLPPRLNHTSGSCEDEAIAHLACRRVASRRRLQPPRRPFAGTARHRSLWPPRHPAWRAGTAAHRAPQLTTRSQRISPH